MKKEAVKFFTVVVMFFCLVISAQAGDFKNVVVFGDSLCDSGNVFALKGGTYPPAPYEGRFSDGPVWVEYLVKTLGIPGAFCNYAHGGAMTGETNTYDDPTGFTNQVLAYTTFLDAAAGFPTAFPQPKETLFIIWIGANDFLSLSTDVATAIGNAVTNVYNGMTQLASAGAVTFMVVNLPDLGSTPKMNGDPALATQGVMLAGNFNSALETMLQGFEAAIPAVEIIRLDTFALLTQIINNPAAYGFTNVTDKKFDEDAETVAEGNYLFWDEIHPTTMTHKLVAGFAASLLSCSSCAGVPSFGTTDLALTVPYAELGTAAVGFKLDYCGVDPTVDPDGYYWKLDPLSITVD
ncbi:MAG: SGNH/GDSL hydrolase family protein [Pseudomonadota bacterium]|nr:SGNH/GDSL hydrolase family protein [Pseudomonadota bacterium]